MNIVVFSLKGGVGKTSIALTYALETGYPVVTNEIESSLGEVLPEEQFMEIGFDEDFPQLEEGTKVIYDLGGFLDHRIVDLLKSPKTVVLVPWVEGTINEQRFHKTIDLLSDYTDNILCIANRVKIDKLGRSEKVTELRAKVPHMVLPLVNSKGFENIFNDGLSPHQQVKELAAKGDKSSRLRAHSFRSVIENFDNLMEVVEKWKV